MKWLGYEDFAAVRQRLFTECFQYLIPLDDLRQGEINNLAIAQLIRNEVIFRIYSISILNALLKISFERERQSISVCPLMK